MRLSGTILYVKNLDRVAAFYEAVLGMAPQAESRTASWAEFATEGASLGLHRVPPAIADSITITDPPKPREETPVKLRFEVASLAAARNALLAFGARSIERPWGSVDVVDPEGNIFELREAAPQNR